MREILTDLELEGALTLPDSSRLYDVLGMPSLPFRIQLVKSPTDKPKAIDPSSIPWRPELRFAAELFPSPLIDDLERVQNFLVDGGTGRPIVPMKERSLELFCDEKRLDILRFSSLFRPGRLTLDLLRCQPIPPPLIWEQMQTQDAPKPILVIENHSTYYSFCQWNQKSEIYSAIIYGAGAAIQGAIESLPQITSSVNWNHQIKYFGDLDSKGLSIPLSASSRGGDFGLPPIESDATWYRLLLQQSAEKIKAGDAPLAFDEALIKWLPQDCRDEVKRRFQQGSRTAQEFIGLEFLLTRLKN